MARIRFGKWQDMAKRLSAGRRRVPWNLIATDVRDIVYTDTTAAGGTSYEYRVTTESLGGENSNGIEVTATVP